MLKNLSRRISEFMSPTRTKPSSSTTSTSTTLHPQEHQGAFELTSTSTETPTDTVSSTEPATTETTETSMSNPPPPGNPGSISCLGVSVPCDEVAPDNTAECPSLENVQREDINEYVSDKEIEMLSADQFAIRQSIGGFKANAHYWFVIRNDGEIRFLAPYAADTVDFFTEHYFVDQIGHTSALPLDEFIGCYNDDHPAKVVKYAGSFATDSNGKVIKWSNDSGHFQPSVDYAAAIAKALGITDATFVPFEDSEQQSIFYQQYKSYTGPFSAHSPFVAESEGDVFYPHDYHTWYKYHGQQLNVGGQGAHHAVNGLVVLINVLLIVLVIVGVPAVLYVRKRRRAAKKVVNTELEDETDELNQEDEEEDEER